MFWIGLLVGSIAGGCVGAFAMCLANAGKDDD